MLSLAIRKVSKILTSGNYFELFFIPYDIDLYANLDQFSGRHRDL